MTRIEYYKELMKNKNVDDDTFFKNGVILEELIRQRMEILEKVKECAEGNYILLDNLYNILEA